MGAGVFVWCMDVCAVGVFKILVSLCKVMYCVMLKLVGMFVCRSCTFRVKHVGMLYVVRHVGMWYAHMFVHTSHSHGGLAMANSDICFVASVPCNHLVSTSCLSVCIRAQRHHKVSWKR